jgi:hypothetical protein
MATVKKLTKQQIKEHKTLIMGLGGSVVVAKLIRQRLEVALRANAVSNWMVRGIPDGYRPCLAVAASEKKVAVPKLFLDPGKLPAPISAEVPYL